MSAENILLNFAEAFIGGEAKGVPSVIINLAEDLSSMLKILFYLSGALGILLFAMALFDIRHIKQANSKVSSFSVTLKLVTAALMGQLATFVGHASASLSTLATPMYPESYAAKARSLQESDPMVGMLFGVLAIVTLLGWIYAFKSLYLFHSASSKDDKETHIMKALNTLIGSILIVNFSFIVMNVVQSAGGSSVSSFGGF